jgi:hypothetical protein
VQDRSPAQTCATALGVVLVVVGIAGFFYNGTFTSDERIHDNLLGAFSVNGWSNALHVALGIWGLSAASPRTFCWGAGLLLVALGVWGFVLGTGQSILSIIPVNAGVNAARLVLGGVAVAAAVSSR